MKKRNVIFITSIISLIIFFSLKNDKKAEVKIAKLVPVSIKETEKIVAKIKKVQKTTTVSVIADENDIYFEEALKSEHSLAMLIYSSTNKECNSPIAIGRCLTKITNCLNDKEILSNLDKDEEDVLCLTSMIANCKETLIDGKEELIESLMTINQKDQTKAVTELRQYIAANSNLAACKEQNNVQDTYCEVLKPTNCNPGKDIKETEIGTFFCWSQNLNSCVVSL